MRQNSPKAVTALFNFLQKYVSSVDERDGNESESEVQRAESIAAALAPICDEMFKRVVIPSLDSIAVGMTEFEKSAFREKVREIVWRHAGCDADDVAGTIVFEGVQETIYWMQNQFFELVERPLIEAARLARAGSDGGRKTRTATKAQKIAELQRMFDRIRKSCSTMPRKELIRTAIAKYSVEGGEVPDKTIRDYIRAGEIIVK